MLDMVFRGLVCVPGRQLRMAVGDQCLMRGMGMVAFFVMLGSIAMMSCSQFVMIGGGVMVFGARKRFRQWSLLCRHLLDKRLVESRGLERSAAAKYRLVG